MNHILFCTLWGLLRLWFWGIPYVHPFQHGVVEGSTRVHHLRSEQSLCVWQMQQLYGKWEHRHHYLHDDLLCIQSNLGCHWSIAWSAVYLLCYWQIHPTSIWFSGSHFSLVRPPCVLILLIGACSIIRCVDNPAQNVSVHLNTWYPSMNVWWTSGWVTGRRSIICTYPYPDVACNQMLHGNISCTAGRCSS